MNREIKFRGKRLDNGEWVYGYYFETLKNGYHISESPLQIFTDPFVNRIGLSSFNVDPDTVGQYTGLKDKNGKEIYEGDIMTTFAILASDLLGSKPFNVSVEWNGCGWIANGSLSEYQCRISEVIGNIHENPELL